MRVEADTFSTKDISRMYKIPESTIVKRLRKMGMKKTLNRYRLTKDEISQFLDFHDKEMNGVYKRQPEVIYVHTTWHILESKMNYMKV